MAVRVVPPSVTHVAGDLDPSAVWNAGPLASNLFLTNVPIFSAHSTAALSVASATDTIIPLAATAIDSDSGHSNATNPGRYTAQVSGIYMVSGVVAWAFNNVGDRQTYISKNGALLTGTANSMKTSAADPMIVPSGAILVALNASDYVELVGNQTSGGALNTSATTMENCAMHVWWVAHI